MGMDNEDGKHVVVVDGKRASKAYENKNEADAEAERQRKRLTETQGSPAPRTVAVKQTING